MHLEEINELSIAIIKAIEPMITEVADLKESVKKLSEKLEQAENSDKAKKLEKYYDEIV